jgi:hypothetical protein
MQKLIMSGTFLTLCCNALCQNVGIGTSAPSAYGHGGNNRVTEISNPNTGSNIQSHLILSTNGTSGSTGGITWASQNVPGTEKRLGYIGNVYETNNAARMVFYTRNEAGNFGEKLTVMGNGNVGIGTAVPLAKLHISGNVKIDGTNTMEFGAGIAGKEVSAGKIGYQAFGTFDALDIVGAGTGANRKIKFWNEGGAEFSGNIGVGNAATGLYKMDIADRIRIRSSSASSTAGIALNNSNNSVVSAFIGTKDLDLVGLYGSNSGWGFLMNTNTGAIGIGYQNPVAGYRLSVLGNQFINGLISTTGGAEIGGDISLGGVLYANGGFSKYFGYALVYDNSTFRDADEYSSTNLYCSIVSSSSTAASQFIAFSDARIKDIRGISNSAKDLTTINSLIITDYTMKDKVYYGNRLFKKVIAQEVEKVYPQAVSTHTEFIPNVYQVTNKIEKTASGYRLHFAQKHNISSTAKKIKIQAKDNGAMQEVDISAIPSEKALEIISMEMNTDKIFVYGEQVNDFRAVDYEGLTTLNISATQELSKLIDAMSKKIAALDEEIRIMKESNLTVAATKKQINKAFGK